MDKETKYLRPENKLSRGAALTYPFIVSGEQHEVFFSNLLLVVFTPVLAQSGLDAYDLAPVGRVLVGVCGPHEKRVIEEAPDELHADRETGW